MKFSNESTNDRLTVTYVVFSDKLCRLFRCYVDLSNNGVDNDIDYLVYLYGTVKLGKETFLRFIF